ncbi:uncharacterized protein LOC143199105 [Rhynchophorus ferrugineus]|uniref:Uncharacterized protein n=1 Tax=Rhynchophorus ferrugineus TaxID=354439 RepID=A0A834IL55_RHYFE|nr:hypothetical protein GWI33_006763 [Rhynchophorus ferrugineus]
MWWQKKLLISFFIIATNASFFYGEPCSPRNTAYLYINTWNIPDDATRCVDITGYRDHSRKDFHHAFFKLVAEANTLYGDHMNLTIFPVTLVHLLPLVETVDFSGNLIKKIPPRANIWAPRLAKLLLRENLLQMTKKRPFIQSDTLQTLMLSNNKITKIYPITFTKLPALEVLYLDGNNIKNIYPTTFLPLKILKYLHLGDNAIEKFPPKEKMPPKLMQYIQKKQRILNPKMIQQKTNITQDSLRRNRRRNLKVL